MTIKPGTLIPFPLRVNRFGRRVGVRCLACWSLVTEFENGEGMRSAWCACDWPDDETGMEIVEGFTRDLKKPV